VVAVSLIIFSWTIIPVSGEVVENWRASLFRTGVRV
jgi:hypothetical protein